MIEPHLFIFAFQNYIYIYLYIYIYIYIYTSQHRATGGSWSITTAVVKICHRHSPSCEIYTNNQPSTQSCLHAHQKIIGMHRNKNSLLKSSKIKHLTEGRIRFFALFSPPCRPILPFFSSLLHKLNSQNLLFTVLSCFTKKMTITWHGTFL